MHSSGWTQTQQTALPMMQSRDTASTTMLPRDSIRWPIQRSVIILAIDKKHLMQWYGAMDKRRKNAADPALPSKCCCDVAVTQ
jgi:hypothetical protein